MPAAYLTIPEVADLLRVDERTVRRWISAGELPARRYGRRAVRIREADLEAFGRPLNVAARAR